MKCAVAPESTVHSKRPLETCAFIAERQTKDINGIGYSRFRRYIDKILLFLSILFSRLPFRRQFWILTPAFSISRIISAHVAIRAARKLLVSSQRYSLAPNNWRQCSSLKIVSIEVMSSSNLEGIPQMSYIAISLSLTSTFIELRVDTNFWIRSAKQRTFSMSHILEV